MTEEPTPPGVPLIRWPKLTPMGTAAAAAGVLLAIWCTSWVFVVVLAAWVAVGLAVRHRLSRLPRGAWRLGLVLGGLVLAEVLAPAAPRTTLPPATVSTSLMTPGPVLASASPESWLGWATSLSRATPTAAGMAALGQGLLAYPEDVQFALDLSAAYRILASQSDDLWEYQQLAWYYGVVGGQLPVTGPPEQP